MLKIWHKSMITIDFSRMIYRTITGECDLIHALLIKKHRKHHF